MSNLEGFASAYFGRLHTARARSRQAADLAQHAGHRERAALYEAGAAVQEAIFGNSTAARGRAAAALDLSRDREVEYGAAFALALNGHDSMRAQTLANDLATRFPEDTAVQFSYLPALRALFALNQKDPLKTIELLQIAAQYELGEPPSTFYGFFGALYPVYVRGLAYLAADRGAEAAAEFQKIVDHRGIVLSDPIGAVARVQLGRGLAASGDTAKAALVYEDVLSLWKDADSDVLMVKQARAEYENLQRANRQLPRRTRRVHVLPERPRDPHVDRIEELRLDTVLAVITQFDRPKRVRSTWNSNNSSPTFCWRGGGGGFCGA